MNAKWQTENQTFGLGPQSAGEFCSEPIRILAANIKLLHVLPGDPRLPADAGHPRPPLGLRVLGVAVLEAGEAGRAARGAGAAPPAPPTALPGHGRGLDEAGVGLAVVSLEGVAAVLGRWRRHRGGHLGGSLLVLRNLLLQLAIGITIFRNKLEIFTTLN